MQTATHHAPTGTLADELYGPLTLPQGHVPNGRAPFGYRQDTTAQTSGEAVQTLADAKGAHALFTPAGPLFWAILLGGVFLIVNDRARR